MDFIILQHPTVSEDESKEKEHRLQSGLKKKLKNKQTQIKQKIQKVFHSLKSC